MCVAILQLLAETEMGMAEWIQSVHFISLIYDYLCVSDLGLKVFPCL